MTPVARFKRAHKLTYPQLAKLLGLKVAYAKQLGCGAVKRVSPDLALQIEKLSCGEIRAEELVFPEKHQTASEAAS